MDLFRLIYLSGANTLKLNPQLYKAKLRHQRGTREAPLNKSINNSINITLNLSVTKL